MAYHGIKRRRLNGSCERELAVALHDQQEDDDYGDADLDSQYSLLQDSNRQYNNVHVDGRGLVHQGDNNGVHNHYYTSSQEVEEADQDRLKFELLVASLTFERMDARLRNVATALPQTCGWLFQHEDFQAWYNQASLPAHNGFLWIKGKPGCGKSTIMKNALTWVKRKRPNHWIFVSYFFNARAHGSLEKSSLGLYRSLVHQLLSALPTLKPLFLESFSSKVRANSVDDWTELELQGFIIDVIHIATRPNMCIFIDALDEGDESDIRQMINFLEDLAIHSDSSKSSLRICLSSRHYPHISIKKGLSLVVEDQAEHDSDIAVYVRSKLINVEHERMDELQDTICNKSSGVFLWVVLVVGLLNKICDRGGGLPAMIDCLHHIPEGLEGLFAKILARDPESAETCVCLLQWVLFATRPLNPMELYLAVQYSSPLREEDELTLPSENTLNRYLLNSSRGLVEVTKANPPVVQFIHETVRGFLMGPNGIGQIDEALSLNVPGLSHQMLRSACLQCISRSLRQKPDLLRTVDGRSSFASFADAKTDGVGAENLFVKYSVSGLFAHADAAEASGLPQTVFLQSMSTSNNRNYLAWVCYRNKFEKFAVRKYTLNVPLLYVTAEQNLPHLVEALARGLVDVNVKSERYGNALQAACFAGHEEIAQCLIENGANVNAVGGEHRHALIAAIFGKRYLIVNLLRRHGASPPVADLRSAFITMVARGSVQGAKILIDIGVDPNSTNMRDEPAVYMAVHRRNFDMLNLLLQHGADANGLTTKSNIQRAKYGSALQLASDRGFTEMVKLLISAGANVNWSEKGSTSPLWLASFGGHKGIVQILLEAKANPNTRSREGILPLLHAIQWQTEDIVRILLNHEADMSLEGNVCGGPFLVMHNRSIRANALQCASLCLNPKILQILLEYGADINAQGGTYGTALQAASYMGNWLTVKFLLEHGANVNVEGGLFGNALCVAAVLNIYGGVERQLILQGLLQYGADVNAKAPDGQHALVKAACVGDVDIINLLVKKGAGFCPKTGSDESVWHQAIKEAEHWRESDLGRSEMIQVLRDGLEAARRNFTSR